MAKDSGERTKNIRHRKKSHYNAIRRQMEFYFGDANLSKDRFLMQMIKDDPFVPLDVFMTFNKIKKLTTNIDEIAKSITNSKLLELNASATCVRRRTEIPEHRNADERTIYVESLPQNADHEWVIKAFSRYGTVAYVSLPKYRHSKKIKEFGFVEFEDAESIEKALNAFRVFNGVLSMESTNPDELVSVTSYIKEKQETEATVPTTPSTTEEKKPNGEIKSGESDGEETVSESDDDSDFMPAPKRIKLDVDTPTSAELEKPPKKKRKHRKKSATVVAAAIAKNKDAIPDITELKIVTKKEWKRLRNKYLNLQREKAGEIKRQISLSRGPKSTRTTPRLPIHRSPHNMNFYTDRDKEAEDANKPISHVTALQNSLLSVPMQRDPLFHYESGLIVHVRLHESCVDVKSFKAEMRQYTQVKYVDIKEGAIEAYLRCDCATSAQKLLRQIACAEYTCEILSGMREEVYWQKIMKDRNEKLNKTVKIKPKRGREKVKQQSAQHIRFDDED